MEDEDLLKEVELKVKALLKKEKDKRIKKEIAKLKKLFKDIGPEAMEIALSLIKNAAFMTITLEYLQEAINTDGAVSEYKNGENQFGTKKSPEVEIYNTMIKNHMGIMRQLTDLMPEPILFLKTSEEQKKDEFNKILRRESNGPKTT